jgi:N-acetyllactosaminide 3-alpha-galactosyltransferase
MKKLKIAMLTSYYFPHKGGVERYVDDLSHALAKRGHKVTIFCHYPGPVEQSDHDPVRIVRIPTLWGPYSPIFSFLPKRQLQSQDILHSHGTPFFFTNQATKITSVPHVLTYHCDIDIPEHIWFFHLSKGLKYFLNHLFEESIKKSIKKVDKIVATTKSYAETSPVLKEYEYTVIPVGIHVDTFKVALQQARLSGIQRETCEILYVGRLVATKGLVFLIEAAKILRNRGQQFKLTIVGIGEDLLSLKLMVHTYDLNDYVTFTGEASQEELYNHYSRATMLVLPSFVRFEAFGIVQLEALAMGLPVIVSDLPGVNEVVNNSQGGWLVPPADPHALADTISYALKHPEEREYRAQQGQAYVYQYYDWDPIASQFEDLYYKMIQEFSQKGSRP